MDPLTQGVFGATLAQSFSKPAQIRVATAAGAVGGMLADVDIFIRSTHDPLLNLEFHRHFTHALIFIPVGGLIAAFLCFPFCRKHLPFKSLYGFTTLGYATAGFLDTCTTYGTHLLWPFNEERLAWSIISIIDPLFTLPLIMLCWLAWAKRSQQLGVASLSYALLYLLIGVWQHNRAINAVETMAQSRGHSPSRLIAHPSLGNQLLWRGIYEFEDRIYVDGYNIGFINRNTVHYPGQSLPHFDLNDGISGLAQDSVAAQDIKRFYHFSDGWVNQPQGSPPYILGDIRYAMFPQSIQPLWGITVDLETPHQHTTFEHYRQIKEGDFLLLGKMILGRAIEE